MEREATHITEEHASLSKTLQYPTYTLFLALCYQPAFPHESTHTRAQQQLSTWTSISHSRMDSCQQWKLNWIYLKCFTLPPTHMYLQSREWNESFFSAQSLSILLQKQHVSSSYLSRLPAQAFEHFTTCFSSFSIDRLFTHIVTSSHQQKKVLLMSTLGKNHSFLRLGLPCDFNICMI